MPENKPEELNSQAVPFFARFLEGQSFEDLSDEASEAISGGSHHVTKKKDDEIFVTQKFPSDSDEYVTLKYPSDGDDEFPTE
ncbi:MULTISPECIES: microviridin/marinostatin family tricyclic proteinase inhibitor [Nostoc]|uniref:Microviridin/marinostatin family tricyclic proteinase inhibitor n=1 Tax=Nostoc paludosum FACHB-159 TaxID=2692908 RepID=A0ABR8K465_9NOSO|nr:MULTISPECIES: microviridin/marinostatin family tricyclic proteinase inhibitor [Nostoc]MBD2677224.1 microviridin/marinostatin family tricyclic proteinase inhibitor [Nostoc sp. FACHB-857]MBD2732967.1 microviridin/marinostatin family tricyclic proteinase inhibitor [Nostoc paludosum FACHB-159]